MKYKINKRPDYCHYFQVASTYIILYKHLVIGDKQAKDFDKCPTRKIKRATSYKFNYDNSFGKFSFYINNVEILEKPFFCLLFLMVYVKDLRSNEEKKNKSE